MEQKGNKVNIPLLGIARSGSNESCTDGKCNEVIGMEYKDGGYYPYAPSVYNGMSIDGADKVWIHNTSSQSNWIKLYKGKLYWSKELENKWERLDNTDTDYIVETPIDFTGNLISFGTGIFFLFYDGKYIRFTRSDLDNITFSISSKRDRIYGIRTRYKWEVLAGMEKNQSKGFAETICGLYNKIDNKVVEENKLIGACYIRYAFRLYDGSYVQASEPILLTNFEYDKLYYKTERYLNIGGKGRTTDYDYEKNKFATPLFGTIYGDSKGNSEFGGHLFTIPATVTGLGSNGQWLPSSQIYFWGLRRKDFYFNYGAVGWSTDTEVENNFGYNKQAGLKPDVYRKYCSWLYKNQDYQWTLAQEGDVKSVRSTDEVFSDEDKIKEDFNTEEMSCISVLANSSDGVESGDFCDVYAFKKGSSISIKRQGNISKDLKNIILSVDVFMTRPILPTESSEQETIDRFQCVEHRKIKNRKSYLEELQSSQRAYYKVLEIPFEDLTEGGKEDFSDKDFDGTAIKNITAKKELVSYSNHTMKYNYSYNFNQKIHISDFIYELYKPKLSNLCDANNTFDFDKQMKVKCVVEILVEGKSYYVSSDITTKYLLHSSFYYPDARASKVTFYIQHSDKKISNWQRVYSKTFTLKPSNTVDMAYYESEDGKSIINDWSSWDYKTYYDNKEEDNIVRNAINNIMRVSDTGNPIVFPYTYSYQISNGKIIGISSNAVALSQGQYGEHKLFVFTTDGIWAMKTDESGKTFYKEQDPVSREVCNNKNSICQIDGGVVFSSEKGLMIISGKDAILLSQELNGNPVSINHRTYDTSVNNINLVLLKDNHSDIDFREYLSLKDTNVMFVYKKNKLLIYNRTKSYCYFMDISSKITTKLSYSFSYHISDYPNDKAVSGDVIYTFPIDSDDTYIDTLIQTRPIKLGSHEYKSSYRAVIRGKFDTTKSKELKYISINSNDYPLPFNSIQLKNPEYSEVNIRTFNEEPINIEFNYDVNINVNSYQIGQKILSPKYSVNGDLIYDSDGNLQFEEVTIKGFENPEKVLKPNLSDSTYMSFVMGGYSSITWGIKRDKPYRNMQIINPTLLIKDKEDSSFSKYITIEGTFKDDNNKMYTHNFSWSADFPYKTSYYVDSISSYDKYELRSFIFFIGYTYNLEIPYVTSDGIVKLKSFSVKIKDNVPGEKVISAFDIIKNEQVNGYARITYDYTEDYEKVIDYDNNGLYNGEDILTWIKLSVFNSDLISLNQATTILEKDTYYSYDKYVESPITQIFKPIEKKTEQQIIPDYSFGLVTQVLGQYFDDIYIDKYSSEAESVLNLAGDVNIEKQDITNESGEEMTNFKLVLNPAWKMTERGTDIISMPNYMIEGCMTEYKYSVIKGENLMIMSSYLYDGISLEETEKGRDVIYQPYYNRHINNGLYPYRKYDLSMLNLILGKTYEIFIPYAEDKLNKILGVKRYVFTVRDDISDYKTITLDDGTVLKVIGAKSNYTENEYAVGVRVDDNDGILRWVEQIAQDPNYTKDPSIIISGTPETIVLNKGTNYSLTDINGNNYQFEYTGDTQRFFYDDLIKYLESEELQPIQNKPKLFFYSAETKQFTEDELYRYLKSHSFKTPAYLPYELRLDNPSYLKVILDDEELSNVYYVGNNIIMTDVFIDKIKSNQFKRFELISSDTVIEGLVENVNVRDLDGTEFSFYSNYPNGKTTYGNLINDYYNNALEQPRKYKGDKEFNISTGTVVRLFHDNVHISFIYKGKNAITLEDLIVYSATAERPPISFDKHIGLYVYGSNDGNRYGLLGGEERTGSGMIDILSKIERLSVKYIRLVFVGNISSKSHIDSIEIQAMNKYDNKIR